MTYSLKGDRHVEYAFVGMHIPRVHARVHALDIGPGAHARMARHAIKQGWHVVGIDLVQCPLRHNRFTFIKDDFLTKEFKEQFELVLNVSSIEHFGIPGRYGIKRFDEDADLRAMHKIRDLMTTNARMILTIPIGRDTVLAPFHRVYGRERLPRLFDGYRVVHQRCWAKFGGVDNFKKTTQNTALSVEPTLKPHHYYAIGGFVLEAANE